MIIKFKIFESLKIIKNMPSFKKMNLKYAFDDYVYVDQNKNNCKFKSKNFEELEPYSVIKIGNAKSFDRTWDYQVESYNYIKNRFENDYIVENSIIRKLTPEEIEEYEAKKAALKYNM